MTQDQDFLQMAQRSEAEWVLIAQQYLDEGQYFLAQDTAAMGLSIFPKNRALLILSGKALLLTGALEEARDRIEPLCLDTAIDSTELKNAKHALDDVLSVYKNGPAGEDWKTLQSVGQFAYSLEQAASAVRHSLKVDDQTLGLLGEIYARIAKRTGDKATFERAAEIYRGAFRKNQNLVMGLHASGLLLLSGKPEDARNLAQKCLQLSDEALMDATEPFILLGVRSGLKLILGDLSGAEQDLTQAVKLAGSRKKELFYLRDYLLQFQKIGLNVGSKLRVLLKPPTVVAFTGHMIDTLGRKEPRFPGYLEQAVREGIEEKLAEIDAEIGYALPACGGDVLFFEALLDRGAELNILMPFDAEDYSRESVRFAGRKWEQRYRQLLKLANTVVYATTEHYLGDDNLFQFAGLMLFGQTMLRAKTLGATPYLLAAYDGKDSGFIGGASDLVARWPNAEETVLHVDTHVLLETIEKPKSFVPAEPYTPEDAPEPVMPVKGSGDIGRTIKSMLFADVVGFSKLEEQHVPGFMSFLRSIAKDLDHLKEKPVFINTWGDAIFSVLDSPMAMAEYALALKKSLFMAAKQDHGLPAPLSLRIGLHAGPAYEGDDPITGRKNFYGSHVNRAARIEPVTVPGKVYASEQFVALLAAEESLIRAAAERKGESYISPWVYEYIGTMALAKKFGEQKIYHLRER